MIDFNGDKNTYFFDFSPIGKEDITKMLLKGAPKHPKKLFSPAPYLANSVNLADLTSPLPKIILKITAHKNWEIQK